VYYIFFYQIMSLVTNTCTSSVQFADKLAGLINGFEGLSVERDGKLFTFRWQVFTADGHVWQSLGGLAAGGSQFNDPNGQSLRSYWGRVQFGRTDFRLSRLVEGYERTEKAMADYDAEYRAQFQRYTAGELHCRPKLRQLHCQ
jgi:hypothetical protein